MKSNDSIFVGYRHLALVLVVVLCGLVESAYCAADRAALLLQQTPLQGGTVSPSVGVHQFDLNSDVTLTAVPKPGYQFVYWLGDVSDPTSNNTVAYLNAPKIIIAVFEQVEYELLAVEEMAQSTSGGSGLRPSARDYGGGGGGGGGGMRPRKWRWPTPPEEEEEEQEDFPVPEEDIPVPEQGEDLPAPKVPEPATGVLLVLGSMMALARRRQGEQKKSR